MRMSRKSNVVSNVTTDILLQFVSAVSNFVISRLILKEYGSVMNGLINSITQFFSYIALVELGVGAAAIVALYKPIADSDYTNINIILTNARKKYDISAAFYMMLSFALAVFYPFTISEQVDYRFAFCMVLILSGSGVIDFGIIGRYKVFLIASQKYYILNLYKSIRILVVMVGSCLLMQCSVSLIALKIFAVCVHLGEALCLKIYLKHYFPQISFYRRETILLMQQKNALLHQLCNVIIYNTDIVVLTFAGGENSLKEISVYTVYAMVLLMITNLMKALTNGVSATFGDMLARKEYEKLKSFFNCYEYWYLMILYAAYTCFIVLVVPFVSCYTYGVKDVDYARFAVGLLFGLSGMFAQIKDATGVLITATGQYKQTQKYVIFEAIVNIVISLLLVRKYGIIGVLVGTLVSHVVSDVGWIVYVNQNILKRRMKLSVEKNTRNMLLTVILILSEYRFIDNTGSWFVWIRNGLFYGSINFFLFMLVNGIFDIANLKWGIYFVKSVLKKSAQINLKR